MQVADNVRTFEDICELGRMARTSMDEGRWIIGDLALEVETVYRNRNIDEFAKQINLDPKRVYECRSMCKFYQIPARAEYLAANPMLTWSHLERVKRKCGDSSAAYGILDRCSDGGWTVRELQFHLANIDAIAELTLPVASLGLDLRAAAQAAGYDDDEIVRVVVTEVVRA